MATAAVSCYKPAVDTTEYPDPYCDPANPVQVTIENIKEAKQTIGNALIYTPCSRSHLSTWTDMDIYLKQEFLQYTGNFKERGARNTYLHLSPEQKTKGCVSASLGNHAQAMSYHGWKNNIPITVVMPVEAPIMKIQKCKNYHADVVVQGNNMADAKKIAMKLAHDRGALFINGYDHPHVIAGQGTVGLEIAEQCPDVDVVVVPCGGGGLIAGIAVAIKAHNPNIKVVGVEPENMASFAHAVKVGKPETVPGAKPTIADGLAVATVGVNSYKTCAHLVDKWVAVSENYIAIAILRLVEQEKMVCEGAGASPLAAIMSGQLDEFKGKKLVLVLSGGNIDTSVLGRCLERGLAAEARLVKFNVIVSDRPGGVAELSSEIAKTGASIKYMFFERAWVTSDIYSVKVKCLVETTSYAHAKDMHAKLQQKYDSIFFVDFPDSDITCHIVEK